MYNKLNLSIEVNFEFLYKAFNKTIKWCLMWIMTILKHGKLNRTNYLICTVLVILFFLVLNIIIDNNEFCGTLDLVITSTSLYQACYY